MEKPEVDQSVLDKAEATLDTMLANHGYEGWRKDSIETIARAILSAVEEEREACAEVAGQQWKATSAGWNDVAESASKITSGETATTIRNRKRA